MMNVMCSVQKVWGRARSLLRHSGEVMVSIVAWGKGSRGLLMFEGRRCVQNLSRNDGIPEWGIHVSVERLGAGEELMMARSGHVSGVWRGPLPQAGPCARPLGAPRFLSPTVPEPQVRI